MFKITLENEYGKKLVFNEINSPFTIVEMDGLNPPEATINTSINANLDGGKFNSSKVNMRSLNIIIAITKNAEQSRLKLYSVLKIKKYIKMYYESPLRDVYIEGYIEAMPISHFENPQKMTLSILCPQPYFKCAQEIINEASTVKPMLHFPFATVKEKPVPFSYTEIVSVFNIANDGDVETGLIIELYARNTVNNPKIFNYKTSEFFGVNFNMQAGDVIEINTNKGQKSIRLLREGNYTNLFRNRMKGSTWFELLADENIFTFEAEYGVDNLLVSFKHYNLYEGV